MSIIVVCFPQLFFSFSSFVYFPFCFPLLHIGLPFRASKDVNKPCDHIPEALYEYEIATVSSGGDDKQSIVIRYVCVCVCVCVCVYVTMCVMFI